MEEPTQRLCCTKLKILCSTDVLEYGGGAVTFFTADGQIFGVPTDVPYIPLPSCLSIFDSHTDVATVESYLISLEDGTRNAIFKRCAQLSVPYYRTNRVRIQGC